jgi:hypothetical protein
LTGFKKCPNCFLKNAADAEACEQCTTELTGIAVSGSVFADAEESLKSAEAVDTNVSAAEKSDQPLETATAPPDPPEVTDDELSADQAAEVSPVESNTGPPPAPPDEEETVVTGDSVPPPAPPDEESEPIAEGIAGPPPPPPDEDETAFESESTPPPAPPEEEPELSLTGVDDGPLPAPDFADAPPAPPAGQTIQATKSGSKIKVIAILAAAVILLTAVGVGAFALLNRGGSEVAVPEVKHEEPGNDAFDDPFNFDLDQDQLGSEPLEPEDELLPELEPEEIPPDDSQTGSGSNGTGSNNTSGPGGQTTPSGGSGNGGGSGSSGSILPIPIANIYIEPHNPTVNKTVIFSAAGSVSSNPNGIIRSYRWVFSDGFTGTGIAVQREFANSGLYVVELEVTDDQGKTGRATDWVTVSAAGSGSSQTMPGGSQSSETGGTGSSTGNWWEVD